MKPLVALAIALAALAGCNFNPTTDDPIDDVVALTLLPSGDVDVCAVYRIEVDHPTEAPEWQTGYRVVRVDTEGVISDRDASCGGSPTVLTSASLSDGGSLAFADSNITRLDATGATAWTVPSPFGHISAASADGDGFVYLARGPQVARLALADGSVAWISELE